MYTISASWQSYTRPLPQVVTYDLDPEPDRPPQWVASGGGSQLNAGHSAKKSSHSSKLYVDGVSLLD